MGNTQTKTKTIRKVIYNDEPSLLTKLPVEDVDDTVTNEFIKVVNQLFKEKTCEGDNLRLMIDRSLGQANNPHPTFKKFKEDNNLTDEDTVKLITNVEAIIKSDQCETTTTSGYNGTIKRNHVWIIIAIIVLLIVVTNSKKLKKLF